MNRTEALEALDAAEPFDVCIIGSGPAGTILGRSLVERGVRTVIVESGTTLGRWFLDSGMRELAAYDFSGDTDYPLTRTRARALGGTSNFWTGRCERLQPADFEDHSYSPDGGWPVRYDDLAPYYETAERALRVRGGKLSDYYPPRESDLPLPAGSDISRLRELMAEVGITVDDSPSATPAKGWHTFRVQKELLPDFVASPHALLVSGLTVRRLVPDSEGRITAAEARTLEGAEKTIRARYYVVCCGGIESPRLLMLSRSKDFPGGIGNRHDRIGRGFNEHAGVNFYGGLRASWKNLLPHYKLGRSYQFYDSFKQEGLGGVLAVFIQSWFFPNHLMSVSPSKIASGLLRILRRIGRPELYIGATIEMLPCDSNRVTLSETRKDRFGDPLAHLYFSFTDEDRRTLEKLRQTIRGVYEKLGARDVREGEITWSRHHIGTCRMGNDPETSVVDANLRVHESPNLHLCGAEVFATGGAGPPVLTLTALALRLADHIVERVKGS